MKTREMIEIMEAHLRGEKIEFRKKTPNSEWRDVVCPLWDWNSHVYRVKQKPLEAWANIYEDGANFHATKGQCDKWATSGRIALVRLEEVERFECDDDC